MSYPVFLWFLEKSGAIKWFMQLKKKKISKGFRPGWLLHAEGTGRASSAGRWGIQVGPIWVLQRS